jgi:hypothetical protein
MEIAFGPPAACCFGAAPRQIDATPTGPYTSRMVEYAILVGGTAFRTLFAEASTLADSINWTYVEWGAAILIMLRIVFWAFSPGPNR